MPLIPTTRRLHYTHTHTHTPTLADKEDTDSGKEESSKESDDSGLDAQTKGTIEAFSVPAIDAEEYRAIDSYEAEGPGQVSFEEGDIISVLDKIEDGRWSFGWGLHVVWLVY